MAVLLYAAAHKTIVIPEGGREEVAAMEEYPADESVTEGGDEVEELSVMMEQTGNRQICVPIPKGLQADDVIMDNQYMRRELWIRLEDIQEDFYSTETLRADEGVLESVCCEKQKNSVILKLQLKDVYEFVSTIDEDSILITCYHPKELYDRVVVADPKGGGAHTGPELDGVAEKDVALKVALLLQQESATEGCKIYYTRLTDEEVPAEERAELARAVQADLYVTLGLSCDESDGESYGIQAFYNEDYYIPGFGNIQWADVLTRNVTIASSNRAIGLFPAEEESVLFSLCMPAAEISLGYLSNEKERGLLSDEEYLKKLAEGLAKALAEGYTDKEPTEG